MLNLFALIAPLVSAHHRWSLFSQPSIPLALTWNPDKPPVIFIAEVDLATLASGPTRALRVCTDVYAVRSLGMESKQHEGTRVAPVL